VTGGADVVEKRQRLEQTIVFEKRFVFEK
jgi:hypothetical protein